jgi:hypothetical protein
MRMDQPISEAAAEIEEAELDEFWAKFAGEEGLSARWDRTSILLIASGCALFAGGAAGMIARHIF